MYYKFADSCQCVAGAGTVKDFIMLLKESIWLLISGNPSIVLHQLSDKTQRQDKDTESVQFHIAVVWYGNQPQCTEKWVAWVEHIEFFELWSLLLGRLSQFWLIQIPGLWVASICSWWKRSSCKYWDDQILLCLSQFTMHFRSPLKFPLWLIISSIKNTVCLEDTNLKVTKA